MTTFNRGVFIPERLPNESKFSYGRDKDGTVSAITHSTENGEENSTTQLRTLDAVTEFKSGNNTVRYAYDKKRRVKAVSLNCVEDYATYSYSGEHTDTEKVTVTMADGTTVTTTKNAHGNVTKSTIGNKTVTNTYDADQQLTKTVDSVSGETTLTYDDNGKATAVLAPDHIECFVYDDNTLFVYICKNILALFENRYDKLQNRFGYYELPVTVCQGNLEGKKKEYVYYISRKKTYSERFATDSHADVFVGMALMSGIGLLDFLEYQDIRQTEEEMKLQNSYFYLDMSRWATRV